MITAVELAERYGLTKAATLNFVRANLDTINKDEVNAYQDGSKNTWYFTDKAVKIIDKLRNVDSVVVEKIDDLEGKNALLEENSTLKTQLLQMQNKAMQLQSKIIYLLESQPKELQAAESSLQAERMKNASLENALAETKESIKAKDQQLQSAHERELVMVREQEEKVRAQEAAYQAKLEKIEQEHQKDLQKIKELEQALVEEKSKSWLKKLFS